MVKRRVRYAGLVALPIAALIGSAVIAQAHAAPALVKTASAHILVSGQGMTLYLFTPDKRNKSVCYGQCVAYWPAVVVPRGMAVPRTMAGIGGVFGTTTRHDGTRQLTFDGAPLYTFVKDKNPGDMTGQGLGGIWWIVVSPSSKTGGSPGPAASTATPTTTSGALPSPTPTAYRAGGYGESDG